MNALMCALLTALARSSRCGLPFTEKDGARRVVRGLEAGTDRAQPADDRHRRLGDRIPRGVEHDRVERDAVDLSLPTRRGKMRSSSLASSLS